MVNTLRCPGVDIFVARPPPFNRYIDPSTVSSLVLCLWTEGVLVEPIEHFHVTSQSPENRTGGHFGVQLNGDLVCCMMRVQNAVPTWQLMDLPHKYVQYRYPVHVICETWAHWPHSSRLSHTSSYLLVHLDGRHAHKYHGVMQTYIIFNHDENAL